MANCRKIFILYLRMRIEKNMQCQKAHGVLLNLFHTTDAYPTRLSSRVGVGGVNSWRQFSVVFHSFQ